MATCLFETSDPQHEQDYQKMVTQLGDFFSSFNEDAAAVSGFSLFKDLDEVRDRYENPVLIGQGGMKSIYRVKDRMTGREVALAIMRNIRGKHLVEQFIKEARLTANLEHPNIMPIYDIGLDEMGEPFFTMKLIRGESLRNILKKLSTQDPEYKKRFSKDVLLEIFMKVCDAVAYAHTKNVLHLDLKPDNIQIGSHGEVLVSDWGLSRYRSCGQDSEEHVVSEGEGETTFLGSKSHGTPGYMSPEQIKNPREKLSGQSDIYSLGCILFELLSLKLPVAKGTPQEMMADTADGRVDFKNVLLPTSLLAVCQQAMAMKTEERYVTANDLKNEILAFRHGFPTMAEESSFFNSLLFLAKRHRTICSLILVSIILLISLTSIFIYTLNMQKKEALLLLDKVKEERSMRRRIEREEVAPAKHRTAVHLYNLLKFNEAYARLQEALHFDPENLSIQKMLGFVCLGKLDFAGAYEHFKRVSEPETVELATICGRLKMFSQSKKPLTVEQISSLIIALDKAGQDAVICQLLYHEGQKNISLEDKIKLAYHVMKIQNPAQKKVRMDCLIKKNDLLHVSLANNSMLDNICALTLLPLEELDLSNTRMQTLLPLNNLPLKVLNIENTLVNDLSVLSGMKLEELNVANTKIVSIKNVKLPLLVKIDITGIVLDDPDSLKQLPELKVVANRGSEKK